MGEKGAATNCSLMTIIKAKLQDKDKDALLTKKLSNTMI
jgi:hypothetical protein